MLTKQLRLDVAQLTDVGRKRPHNEDNMAYVIPKDPQVMMKKGALFVVADGMGGHAAGEVASEIAVDTISYAYYQEDTDDIVTALIHAIKRANTLIQQRAAENMLRSGMGTTCAAGVLRGSTAYIANVGDSRTYLVRKGQVKQISQDHSWVAEQVRAGLLTEDQARSHAQRNVITRCLGTQTDVEVDIFAEELEEGDSFVLCSDGLSGFISEDDIRAIVDQYVPQESVYHLIELANENGGPDNITAIVVRVQEVGWEPPQARRNGFDIANHPTLTDAQTPELALANGSGRVHTSPLLGNGSVHPSDSITAPQPALRLFGGKRSRLVYPTLLLFILLLVTLVGSGIYYLLHLNSPADFDGSVRKAQSLIAQGHNDLQNNNPGQALQHLSAAQSVLLALQNNSLSDAQKTQVQGLLQGQFTTEAKAAITSYNTHSLITTLPCSSTQTNAVKSGGTNAMASSIVTLHSDNGSKTFSYVLGEDNALYQLTDNNTLQSTSPASSTTKILHIASDGTHLLATTGTIAQTGLTAPYSLLLYTPDPSGALKGANPPVTIDLSAAKDSTPQLLTAWGNDVYVVLTSEAAPTSATILYYTIDNKNKLAPATPKNSATISTKPIASIAAFPNRQLFLLTKDGGVQSLTFTGGTQEPPVSVTVSQSVATPLPFSANDFTPSTRLPALSDTQQSLQALQLVGAKLLVAGVVGNTNHLYVVDDTANHRVLDFEVGKGATSSTTSVQMKLDHQYASSRLITNVKGLAQDPKVPSVYFIAQNDASQDVRTLITINMSSSATCAS